MSQLLDSLRRVSRAEAPATGAAWRPTPELLLVRMGYARDPRGRARALLVVGAAGLMFALAWTGIALWPAPDPVQGPAWTAVPERTAPAAPPERVAPAAPPAPIAAAGAGSVETEPQTGSQEQRPVEPAPARTRSARASSARVAFAQALDSERAGDPGRAEALYRQLISRGALLAAAHNNLGLLLQARGDLDGAARELETAIRHAPGYGRAHNNLGVVRLAQGRPREAAERFRVAAELDPRDPGPVVNLALAERDGGLPERAKESLLRALVLSPDSAAAHYNLAVLFDRSGEPGRAAHHYRAFLEHAGAEHAARASSVRARLQMLERTR